MTSSIGTLNENHLHAALKEWIAEPGDEIEAQVDGFHIDVLRGDLAIEIQTASFAAIRPKLEQLVTQRPVRLVFPIAEQRWLIRHAPAFGRLASRRKSPARGSVEDLFDELVSLPELIKHPNFSLDVVLTHEEEVLHSTRRGRGRGRTRRGYKRVERRLIRVVDTQRFTSPEDLAALLPDDLAEPFSTADLAKSSGRARDFAQRVAYCLARAGAIREVGKQGNARLYERVEAVGAA